MKLFKWYYKWFDASLVDLDNTDNESNSARTSQISGITLADFPVWYKEETKPMQHIL